MYTALMLCATVHLKDTSYAISLCATLRYLFYCKWIMLLQMHFLRPNPAECTVPDWCSLSHLQFDKSGRSEGRAWVVFKQDRSATEAIRLFNGANAKGTPIAHTQPSL